jgi:hypothetical protein
MGRFLMDCNSLTALIMEITNLEGLHNIIEARRTIKKYDENKRFDYFVINGQYMLDCFAQVARITIHDESEGNYGKTIHAKDLNVPRVMTQDMFKTFLRHKGEYSYSWGFPSPLPDAGMICPVCKKEYDLDDCYDISTDFTGGSEKINGSDYLNHTIPAVVDMLNNNERKYYVWGGTITNPKYINETIIEGYSCLKKNQNGLISFDMKDETDRFPYMGSIDEYNIQVDDTIHLSYREYTHKNCMQNKLNEDTFNSFIKCLSDAEVAVKSFTKIKNEYGSDSYRGSWYKFILFNKNNDGKQGSCIGSVRIGWRKRVIELDYSYLLPDGTDLTHLFEDENVTKERGLIHAYSLEDLTKYLKIVNDAIHKLKGVN